MADTRTAAHPAPRRIPRIAGLVGLAILLLLASDFIGHSATLGWQGLTRDLGGENRLWSAEAPVATAAIFLHMLGGAAITLLAPLQLAGPVRRRWPAVHRGAGRTLAVFALLTGVAGLTYIALRGTIGGPPMSVAFATYGLCLMVAAVQAVRFARARAFDRHRRWALRLAVLALGSWIYRMHYGLWFLTMDGVGVESDFSGAFDRVQIWAFFVPYLLALELLFWAERRRRPAVA